MTSPCTTIQSDKSIEDALVLMTQKEIRHLPIVDEDDHLLGIISDRDIKWLCLVYYLMTSPTKVCHYLFQK